MYKFVKDGLNIWDSSFMQKEGVHCYSRLLYMYLLSCPLSNILGVYEISLNRIKSDLRLEEEQLKTALAELKESKKVRRTGKYIIIQDAIHYIKINARTSKAIDKIIEALPEKIRERLPKKAIAKLEEYKALQEKKKIERQAKKEAKKEDVEKIPVSLTLFDNQEGKDESDGSYKTLPHAYKEATQNVIKENIENIEEDENKAVISLFEDNAIAEKEKMNPSLTFETFTVEPSEASLKAEAEECKEEDDEGEEAEEEGIKEIYLDEEKNEDTFVCTVAPSEISLKKRDESLKRKRKVEIPDEVFFPQLKERLAPIYAKMPLGKLLPSVDIEIEANNALVAFMIEKGVKAEPLDTKGWLDMREFMRQAKAFSASGEAEREKRWLEGVKFGCNRENLKIRDDKNFLDDCKKENVDEGFGFLKSHKELKKTGEITKEQNLFMSKKDVEEYMNTLVGNMEEEMKIEAENDTHLIRMVWEFYKGIGEVSLSNIEEFKEEFELAKRRFKNWGVDITNKATLTSLLGSVQKYIKKCNGAREAKIPFTTLASRYGSCMEKLKKAGCWMA